MMNERAYSSCIFPILSVKLVSTGQVLLVRFWVSAWFTESRNSGTVSIASPNACLFASALEGGAYRM